MTSRVPVQPTLPVDLGLMHLGMLMQLGGGIMLCTLLMAFPFFPILAGLWGLMPWGTLSAGLALLRSALHLRAGLALRYRPFEARRATWAYVAVAALHTGVAIAFAARGGAGPGLLAVAAVSFAWPAFLAATLLRPRVRRFQRGLSEVSHPTPHGRGVRGTGVLMAAFGGLGLVLTVLLAYGSVQIQAWRASLPGVLWMAAVVVLLMRSALHLHGGAAAIRTGTAKVFTAAVRRYWIATWIAVPLVVAAVAMWMAPLLVATIPWLIILCIWPLVLRAMAQRIALPYDPVDPEREDEPDGGVTALGFLVLAVAVVDLSARLPPLVLRAAGEEAFALVAPTSLLLPAVSVFEQAWASWAALGLAVWAGLELVAATPRWRLASIAYGVGTLGLLAATVLPQPPERPSVAALAATPGLSSSWVAVGVSLVLPVLAIALALRRGDRVSPPAPTGAGTAPTPSNAPGL